jgi:hypothetical protein
MIENGAHSVRLHFVNEDGQLVLPPLEAQLEIACSEEIGAASTNLVLGVQSLPLERPGDYAVNLAVDGRQAASIPLFVRALAG